MTGACVSFAPAEEKCTGFWRVLAPTFPAGRSLRRFRRQNVLRGDGTGGVRVGSWLGDEDRLAVVAQLRDGLADVGERAVVAVLLGAGEVGPRVPAAGQLLHRGDVHDA